MMNLSRYLEWRIASQRFERRPWQLSAEERTAVLEQEGRERRVIVAALAAPEAAEVKADEAVVDAAFGAMERDFADHDAFLTELARGGLDEAGLREALAAELRAGLVLERIGAAAVIDESEVEAYYARHRERMVLPEHRAACHVLITINDDYHENSREKAQARIGEAALALAAGTDFAAVAQRYSECPSALEGGKLGQVRRGQLYPELDEVLFTLAPGEVRTVESSMGFHLLRCDDVIPSQPISFEAAAPSIRRKLESSARDRVLRAWLAQNDGAEKPCRSG